MKDEVATFVCDHAEEIINLLIEDQKVLSDEALNKIHTKIVKEKVLRKGGSADATPEEKEKAICHTIENVYSDENLERLIKQNDLWICVSLFRTFTFN